MSAMFLRVFTDDHQELQKQIGCMAGMFQIFDRQHILAGRQLTSNHNKRLPPGYAEPTSTTFGAEPTAAFPQMVLEGNHSKSLIEKRIISMELSRTSFSSSSCSSFSSVECNTTTQQESPSLVQSTISDKNLKSSLVLSALCVADDRFLDFRNFTKDSINGDPQSLPVKTLSEEDVKNHVAKHRDSLWTMQLLKSMDSSYVIGINGKSREAVQDLQKLSLDSREGSVNTSSFDAKLNAMCKGLDRIDTYQGVSKASNLDKELDSDKRSPNVVAKLMGLETMPRLISVTKEAINSSKGSDSSKTSHENKGDRFSPSDSIIKPIATPRVPIETAPWKKQDRICIPRKTANARREAQPGQKPESMYSEIEKRLKELEFRQSNKDLRALKQILESMQAKGLLEAKKGDESRSRDYPNLTLPTAQNSKIMESRSRRAPECPIVIIRPGNSINKSDISSGLSPDTKLQNRETMDGRKASSNNRMAKDCIPKSSTREISDTKLNGRIEDNASRKAGSTYALELSKPKQPSRENNRNQKKPETERRSRSTLSSSDSSRPQRTPANRHQVESVAPRSKLRRKPVKDNNERSSECGQTRNYSCQGNETSQRSGSSVLTSQVDIEVTSADRSADTNSGRSLSGKAARKAASVLKRKKPSVGLCEQVRITEISSSAAEYPSPTSVLDASFYQDDLPTSLKKSPNVDKGVKSPNSTSEINNKKLQSIKNLLQKLSELTSSDDKPSATDHIASLCETHNPDHHYVSEILLASGLLLKDLSSEAPIQLHSSGHPINPDLFLVLEHTSTPPKVDHEKLHRKLVFDVVNEVLVRRMETASAGPHIEQLVKSRKLASSFPSGQRLLKELCQEIDRFGAKNFRGEGCYTDISLFDEEVLRWSDFRREVAGAVLEIERSIFKDLIDEIVKGETMP